MKILHVISSIDKSSGGPARSVPKLCEYLANDQYQISLVSKPCSDPIALQTSEHYQSYFVSFFTVIRKFKKVSPDIIHLQHIWTPYIHLFAAICHIKKIPYLITPRGMLEPWIMQQNPWKKKLGMLLYQRHDLRKARCIHVTCEAEGKHVRQLGFSNPIALIPNGIDLSGIPYQDLPKDSKTVVFISRIHPKKGIEILLDSWKHFASTGWTLEIAGEGEKEYIRSLQEKIDTEQILRVRLIGAQYGLAKWNLLQNAELFVLPSYSENFGMAIAEALAMGVPVITTRETPWQELETHNAGWWIEPTEKDLSTSLAQALSLSAMERREMGIRGRKLIEKNYTIESIAAKMRNVYEWMTGRMARPAFVSLPGEERTSDQRKKVLHFITSIDRSAGGTTSFMNLLCPLLAHQVDLRVLTGVSPNPDHLPNVPTKFLNLHPMRYFQLRNEIKKELTEFNPHIVHINGIWQPQTWWVQREAQKMGIQVIVSPHGMLETYILNRNPRRKKVALWLYQRKAVQKANMLHATAHSEEIQFRKLGFTNPCVVIPNGVDLKPIHPKTEWSSVRNILFLSRVHPKKGIELLIEAISKLGNKNLKVTIAGEGEPLYVEKLKELSVKHQVADQIQFIGGVYGDAKWELYKNADLFVLPTYSENFGIVIAEALATGVPVITTTGAPWKELKLNNCGWWIEPELNSLIESLKQATSASSESISTMGKNGIQLVQSQYAIGSVVATMVSQIYI